MPDLIVESQIDELSDMYEELTLLEQEEREASHQMDIDAGLFADDDIDDDLNY